MPTPHVALRGGRLRAPSPAAMSSRTHAASAARVNHQRRTLRALSCRRSARRVRCALRRKTSWTKPRRVAVRNRWPTQPPDVARSLTWNAPVFRRTHHTDDGGVPVKPRNIRRLMWATFPHKTRRASSRCLASPAHTSLAAGFSARYVGLTALMISRCAARSPRLLCHRRREAGADVRRRERTCGVGMHTPGALGLQPWSQQGRLDR